MKKTILITGASEGIGRALALQLAGENTNLALVARGLVKLEETALLCKKKESNVLILVHDISDRQQCKKIIEETIKHFNHINILINNAGVSMHSNFDLIPEIGIIEDIFKVNLFGLAYCTYYALPYLKLTKGGIVSIASLQSLTGFPESSLYAASKHAVRGLMNSIRIELKKSGVSVLTVYPGAVDTDIHMKKEVNGVPHIKSRKYMMPVDVCAAKIIAAIHRGKRDLIITRKGKLLYYLNPFIPSIIDKLVYKNVKNFYH